MKLTVLVPALAGLVWGNVALADAQIEIKNPYVVELLDGQGVNAKLLEKSNTLPLKDGKHQVVVSFQGNYSNRNQVKMVTAQPLVINFESRDGQHIVLDYTIPHNENEALTFIKSQSVSLKDINTGSTVKSDSFVMPKVEGFQFTRDYAQELIAMGKALNQPKQVTISTAAVMAANSAPVQVAPAKAQANPQALTELQNWYNKADAETRKAFQIWIIQQQQ